MLRNVGSWTPSLDNRQLCVCVSAVLRLCSAARQSRNLTGSGNSALNNTWPPGEIQLLVVILTMEDIKKAIGEAEKELEVAERLVASKRSALMASVFCWAG